jgi:hypothetical protein
MGFPSSPTNGQQAVVNNITYVYNSTKTAWYRLSTPGVPLSANSLVLTSPNISISTTSGALIVTGGAGIGGNLHADRYYTHNGLYWANNNESILGGLTYSNVEVAAYLTSQKITSANIGGSQIFANANAAAQQTQINSLITNANTNTAAYLSTYTGNVQVGNIVVTGNAYVTSNVFANIFYVSDSIRWAGNGAVFASGGGGSYANADVKIYLESLSNVNIGLGAGINQGANAIAIGQLAGTSQQGIEAIALGYAAGYQNQGNSTVAIGTGAAAADQKDYSVAIGLLAGQLYQSQLSVAIGRSAGQTSQGQESIAIGRLTGELNQGNNSVAIGSLTAQKDQQQYAVAIGWSAGQYLQGNNSIAIGLAAGQGVDSVQGQGNYAVAIGSSAGQTNQGYRSVAIGALAGYSNQAGNSIIISANGQLDSTTTGFFVDPIRNQNAGNVLYYNPVTKEITFDTGGGGGGGITFTASNTAPVSPNVGDKWYYVASDILFEYINDGDSNQWVDTSSPVAPSSTIVSDLILSNVSISSVYNINSTKTALGVLPTVAATPPATPIRGDLWYNTADDVVYQYTFDGTSNYWVDISSSDFGYTSNAASLVDTTIQGNLIPTANVTYFLGNTNKAFGNIYANAVHTFTGLYWAGNGNVVATGGGTGSQAASVGYSLVFGG